MLFIVAPFKGIETHSSGPPPVVSIMSLSLPPNTRPRAHLLPYLLPLLRICNPFALLNPILRLVGVAMVPCTLSLFLLVTSTTWMCALDLTVAAPASTPMIRIAARGTAVLTTIFALLGVWAYLTTVFTDPGRLYPHKSGSTSNHHRNGSGSGSGSNSNTTTTTTTSSNNHRHGHYDSRMLTSLPRPAHAHSRSLSQARFHFAHRVGEEGEEEATREDTLSWELESREHDHHDKGRDDYHEHDPMSSEAHWHRAAGLVPTPCRTCRFVRPARAHHCHTTGTCVRHMDHFCVWTNQTIGYRNLKPFLLFLCYTWCGLVSACLLLWPALYLRGSSTSNDEGPGLLGVGGIINTNDHRSSLPTVHAFLDRWCTPWLPVTATVTLTLAVALVILMAMTYHQVAHNYTAIEAGWRGAGLTLGRPWPLDKGWESNLSEVLGPVRSTWWCPAVLLPKPRATSEWARSNVVDLSHFVCSSSSVSCDRDPRRNSPWPWGPAWV